MKSEAFYNLSFSHGDKVLHKRYVRGETHKGVLVDGFQTAMKLFVQYAKSKGVK